MSLLRKIGVLGVILALLGGAVYVGLRRVRVDADLTRALPTSDRVVNDARYVLLHHPSLERIYIDLHLEKGAKHPERLARAAALVEKHLRESGLFRQVGTAEVGEALAALYAGLPDRLPMLFTARDLRTRVAPLLAPARVKAAVQANKRKLLGLEGIGQSEAVTKDPLGLRDRVMAVLAWLRPSDRATVRHGQLFTRDGRHALIIAEPKGAGADTKQGRKLTRLLEQVRAKLLKQGFAVRVTPVGVFRAALDNESIIRQDTQRALLLATVGIVVLILLCFPRPLVGILALLPAAAGAVVALLVYSFFRPTISALALGFGGALISISVDHGIAFLLFLEQEGGGRRAARRVWILGGLAAITTVGAFSALMLSGFPLLEQLGLFAALGVAASFGFVHVAFPVLFGDRRATQKKPWLPVDRGLAWLGRGRPLIVLGLAGVVVAAVAIFGRPRVSADLESMNTVAPATRAAEEHLKQTWGDTRRRVWALLEGRDAAALQRKGDRLAAILDRTPARQIRGGFSPSHVYPGPERAASNLRAWKRFWDGPRRAALRKALSEAAAAEGFTADAFAPFLAQVEHPALKVVPIPKGAYAALGITRARGKGPLLMLGPVARGDRFDGRSFGRRARAAGLRVWDPKRFGQRLSSLISRTFGLMLAIVGLGVVVLLVLTLLDWRLVLLALVPLVFSLASTLGVLRLLNHPLDIPGLMLAIVVVGMGLDYGLYLVQAHVRFLAPGHRGHAAVRLAVLLAGGSTLLGFSSLLLSDHAVLRSTGLVTSLGIFFSLVGALVLLPPVLARRYPSRPLPAGDASAVEPGGAPHRRRVRARFSRLAPYVRMFARFKIRTDPMFERLAALVPEQGLIVDVGCGFGVGAVWLTSCRPGLRVVAVEPDEERARVARWALGARGSVLRARAEALPLSGAQAEAVLLLDVVHHLDDAQLVETLRRVRALLAPGAKLVCRATVPRDGGRWPWERKLERMRLRWSGRACVLRRAEALTTAFESAGLEVEPVTAEASGREETWLVARARGEQP